MGMFDYVKCEVPLPDGFTGELQTKDLECLLTEAVITKDGRLLVDQGYDEEVPKEEQPYPDAKSGSWQSICGIIRRVPKMVDSNFHGILHFHGSEVVGHHPKEPNSKFGPRPIYKFHDYQAKFTDGKLIEIKVKE